MWEIDGTRLWNSLTELAQIGGTARGGVRRLALTDADRRGRERFAQWCREAGMTVRVDAIGNLFARRAGADDAQPAVLVGSHLDTQPEGGRFDGAYGVLAGLELVRTLNDRGIVTGKPIEIVSWTNEEGARFTPAMLGSAVFTGALPLDAALAARDADGVTLAEALDACGYRDALRTAWLRGAHAALRPEPALAQLRERVDAYFEAHIEQGPVLERHGAAIGVVTGGQAIRWLDATVTGVAAHAGTTPMPYRKDALVASAEIALAIEALVARHAPDALATIGQGAIDNASRNTIAGRVAFGIDLRHPDDDRLDAIERELRDACAQIAGRRGVAVDIGVHWSSPATPFDPACVALVDAAARRCGYAHERIASGAGHDAIRLARCVPAAMVFIPCVGGLSHNAAERALPEHVEAGANVLLGAVLARAGVREHAAQSTQSAHAGAHADAAAQPH
ncbi:Zn-dependent hydrolase [Burkholderia humptydooensis]|uniref:Zn-dependent hydrolase n=3 Tax=Burkholderia humptydooensis TaxID=430531 RepID=A0A7U4P9T5_9BURK|nr:MULTISPECIES: Zn-dependent hydrolase [Burkholderia]AJY38452.1 amidase, hydantoinase/carbamoylase family protein [Burkholderia sp. 2002721687]ALX45607.1 Zn-dependent hydrolase [Burkholderia humptydooensis]EIP86560.1 allantoate amidohydrolase [Burkholderia humptydooensis MSMB43]QPS47097.1 Zn-dependent hydrolase [Burkholderia humptydooensis]